MPNYQPVIIHHQPNPPVISRRQPVSLSLIVTNRFIWISHHQYVIIHRQCIICHHQCLNLPLLITNLLIFISHYSPQTYLQLSNCQPVFIHHQPIHLSCHRQPVIILHRPIFSYHQTANLSLFITKRSTCHQSSACHDSSPISIIFAIHRHRLKCISSSLRKKVLSLSFFSNHFCFLLASHFNNCLTFSCIILSAYLPPFSFEVKRAKSSYLLL